MNPLIKIAAFLGLNLASESADFICDKVSEKDKKRREAVKKRAASINEKYNNDILKRLEKEKNSLTGKHKAELEKLIQQLKNEYAKQENHLSFYQRYSDGKRAAVESELGRFQKNLDDEIEEVFVKFADEIRPVLIEDADERLVYADVLIDDIKNNIDKLRSYRKEHMTDMRKNSLELIYQEFLTLKNKAYAYKSYIKLYKKNLDMICRNSIDDILFSLTLPEKYPYEGELLFLSENELPGDDGVGILRFHNAIEIKVRVRDHDSVEKISASKPLYVEGFDFESYYHPLSVELGAYYMCKRNGGFMGILANVKKYDTKTRDVILQFGSYTQLHIQQRNLLNANHYPPIGSDIMVYPLKEWFDRDTKKSTLYVSQRVEDTEISLAFGEIPVLIPDDKILSFCEYFMSHNLDTEYDDAKIAPMNENDLDTDMLRMQFQDKLLMAVKIKHKADNVQYFEFDSILTQEHTIRADEVFASFHAVIKMYSEDEFRDLLQSDTGEAASDDMNNLLLTVYKEFKMQLEIKLSYDGTRYFSVWEQLTDKLHHYLTYGEDFQFIVDTLPEQKKDFITQDIRLRYYTSDTDALRQYRDKIEKAQTYFNKYSFFTEFDGLRLNVYIHPTYEFVEVTVPALYSNESMINSLMLLDKFTIFKEEIAVPEMRQKIALYHFRAGHLANEKLHTYTLNSKNVNMDQEQIDISALSLYNKRLREDDSQYHALCSALQEKNWFMIQGPPGTGKTTVIRELIWQTLAKTPDSKILIVSQANVAVDNVIRGLLGAGISESRILRCGRKEKIAEDIRNVSFEDKYEKYLKALEKQKNSGNKISADWLDILEHSPQKNSDIGDLFMRDHQIIGATCVGLSQKNIGLENTDFDMVIIDEAGKALAPEIIIPLIKANKAVLIGDHMQLPPVINPVLYDPEKIEFEDRPYINQELFEHSLFERLFTACPASNKTTLTTQYRMPPLIGSMVSSLFYNNAVKNGISIKEKHSIFYDSPMSLIDMSRINEYCENDSDGSPQNVYEAKYAVWLSKQIRMKNKNVKIAIITPYKGQKRTIIKAFETNKYDTQNNRIVVDTVDAFQGDEAEVVIYCTTRARRKTAFYSDYRRLNVAFSRTKNELIILASVKYLEKYDTKEYIHRVLEFVQKNKCIRMAERIQ